MTWSWWRGAAIFSCAWKKAALPPANRAMISHWRARCGIYAAATASPYSFQLVASLFSPQKLR